MFKAGQRVVVEFPHCRAVSMVALNQKDDNVWVATPYCHKWSHVPADTCSPVEGDANLDLDGTVAA